MYWLALLACTAAIAWWVTRWVLRHAQSLGLVDMPNHRSSHSTPTPRGGGLGFVAGGLFAAAAMAWLTGEPGLAQALGLAVLIAAIGLWDDVRPLPVWPRLIMQFLVCGLAMSAWSGATEWLALAVLLLAGVWWLNLFNFMDGIDGLAASQAVFMLLAAALLAVFGNGDVLVHPLWWGILAMAAAVLGFLYWNWPTAHIFMGDVGSTFLGFMLFSLAVISINLGWMGWPAWLIVSALFVSDATVTLLVRVFRGEPWRDAHRQHAYQRLARSWGGHAPVVKAAWGVNVLVMAPLAGLAMHWPEGAWAVVALVYLPVVGLMLVWRSPE